MDTSLSKINAYILTGGQSQRLNADKCLEKLNGQTFTEIIHNKLNLLFKNTYVVGKENNFPEYYFIKDIKPIQCPLNGIVTALEHNKKDWIFVIACDLLLVKTSSINDIYDSINSCIQVVLPNVNDRLQPLCAFYHKSVLKKFNLAIEKGNYSLIKLLDQIEVAKSIISPENEEQFLNINYPEDLKKAKELLKKEK